MAVNRNDPCPCGSGKKYKHCHMKIDKAEAKSGKASRDVRKVIGPRTIPYFYWKRWNAARSRGEYGLLFDMSHEEGTYRSQFGSRVDFFAHAQSHPLPGGPGWNFEKVKLAGDDAYVLSQRGLDDPTQNSTELELMHLRYTDGGYRLWDVRIERQSKDDGTFLAFDIFEVTSLEKAHHEKVEAGYERPDYADKSDDELVWGDVEAIAKRVRQHRGEPEPEDNVSAAAPSIAIVGETSSATGAASDGDGDAGDGDDAAASDAAETSADSEAPVESGAESASEDKGESEDAAAESSDDAPESAESDDS